MSRGSAAVAAPFENAAVSAAASNIAALANFAHFCMRTAFDDSLIDVGEIQEAATRLGIIVEVKGGYDPDKHGEHEYAEPGDEWFEYADWFKELRRAQKAREATPVGEANPNRPSESGA